MQQKLPENIDQLDSFYQEQFKDFSPDVSDSVWESINNNIPKSTSVGTSVSTTYLLKVVGLMLSGIIGISVVTNSFNPTDTSKDKKEIIPITPTKTEEVIPTVKEVESIEEPVIKTEEMTPKSKVVIEKETTTVTKDSNKIEMKKTLEEQEIKKSDFQFVEELNFDE